MAKNHPLFHKLKAIVGYSIAVVVIAVALGVSGLRLILSTANIYQYEVEQLASSLFEQPVKIGRMDAKLSGLMPTLIFHNVELLSEKTSKTLFSLSRVDVGLLFKDLLLEQKINPAQLTIRGMNLFVTRTVEGNIKIKGVDLEALNQAENTEANPLLERWLLQQGEVAIEESTFAWKDEQKAGLTWFFDDVNVLLKKTHERHQLLFSSKLPNALGDEIKIAVDLVGNIAEPKSWDVNTYIESKGFNIIPVQKYINNKNVKLIDGITDLKLWVDWKNENIQQVSGDIKLHDFSYHLNKNKIVNLKNISGIFDAHQDGNNFWNVSVDKFDYTSDKKVLDKSKFSLAFNFKNKEVENFYVKTNQLKLDALSKIITDNHLVSKKHKSHIKNIKAHGDIRDFYIAWQNNELHKFKAQFANLGINAWESLPKLEAISGSVNYAQHKGVISLSSIDSTIGFPRLFRDDFKLDYLTSNINFLNTKEGILFDIKDVSIKNIEVSAVSSAKLWLPKSDTSPYLDLQVYASEGDIAKISHFLPVGIMDDGLVSWLDKALVSGKLDKATILFTGKLNEFPFNNNEGKFLVGLEASQFVLNHQDDWPKIVDAKITAGFTGQGMKLHLLSGETGKNIMSDSYAEIKSFSAAELELDLAASGTTDTTMQYLINTPILPEAKNTVSSMELLGNIDMKVNLYVPLNDEIKKEKSLSYSGSAKIRDASLFMLENKIDITNANGDVFFSDEAMSSKNLSAKILGEPASLFVSSSEKNIIVSANVKMQPNDILNKFDIPGAKKVSGSSLFQTSMTFPINNTKNRYPTLKLKSDLLGVKSALPEQFYKNEKKKQKFELFARFIGENKTQLGVEFGKKSSAILELAQAKGKSYLRKGAFSVSSKKAVLPRKNVLYVDGSINKITPDKWIKALELDSGDGEQSFFVNPIVFNLDKLYILTNKSKKSENNKSISNPRNIPAFEGIIKKLYFDKTFIGRFDFKVSQKSQGLHIDELIVSSKNMKLDSHGDWQYIRGKHKTNMNITLDSKDFGAMLTDLGFAVVIDKGVAQGLGKFHWQGTPMQFSLSKLNGDIKLNLEDGNIVDIDAGAGRLLGFFSLSALPRKLFGDFKDVESGFSFDTAIGEIIIDHGDAYTDGFELKSPIAEISLSGRTGLVEQDYENILEVTPDVGGGVAGATALLVNLPAGIGLWLLDKLTGEQFNEASIRTYEITGSWDKPEIELIEDEEEL